MKALILAAGRGRRLGGADEPKSLHPVGDVSLLERMLAALHACGVAEATIVVGYQADQLRAAAEAIPAERRPALSFVLNPAFTEGSVVSLWCAREGFGRDDLLVMDADVLFPVALLRRLIDSQHPSAFLLDPRSTASGEEMMLLAKEGRVLRIARNIDPTQGDRIGEGVGFLKLAKDHQPALRAALEAMVDAGERERDYEDAIDAFLADTIVGFEEVGDLPWTEIDFAEDLAHARETILPAVEQLNQAATP